MFHIRRFIQSAASKIVIILTTLSLTGCGAIVTLRADQKKYDYPINDITLPTVLEDKFLIDTSRKYGLMALFALLASRQDLKEVGIDGNGCRYLSNSSEFNNDIFYGMPQHDNGQGQWKRWTPPANDSVLPCFEKSGLYYETYIYEDDGGKIEEAVISFRGTENRLSQFFSDWGTDIAAIFGFEPKEYELARKQIPLVIKKLLARFDEDGREIKIYATGHSLGGGLAQQAGYLSRDIKEVFTFNTSPVTNWSQLRLLGAVKNGYPIIHRVYHGGEFLEKIRFISTSFTPARYGRHDIGLQFVGESRSNFGGHSMKIIACNFAEIISSDNNPSDADHSYPVKYVQNTVLKSPNICGKTDKEPK